MFLCVCLSACVCESRKLSQLTLRKAVPAVPCVQNRFLKINRMYTEICSEDDRPDFGVNRRSHWLFGLSLVY